MLPFVILDNVIVHYGYMCCVCVVQSQAHGRIVRKLSKKLKVSSRKYPGTSGFSPLRSSSPVLYTSQTPPRCPSNHFHSGSDESDWSPANHTSSHGTYVCMHMHHNIILTLILKKSYKLRTYYALTYTYEEIQLSCTTSFDENNFDHLEKK